jgi:hypothetical protein
MLKDRQCTQWRKQALVWLRVELTSRTIRGEHADDRGIDRKRLRQWLEDQLLAGVRDEPSLARLPEDERQAWGKLWADVAALLKKAEQRF